VKPQKKKYFINKLNRIILQSDGTSQYEFRKLNEDADWETGPLSEEGMKVLQNARRSGKISVKGNQITLKYAISDDTAYRLE
ncbi:MAG: hypothetical protein OEZ34_17420, partial [Spirochaetia bacterium]|nr:hypothetical protein [Spirochaetia bacterium]